MSEKSDWEQGYDQARRRFYGERKVLTARIAKLEAVIEILEDQQREAKNHLIDKNLHIDSLYEEGYKLQQRIAELEAEVTKCHELQDSYCDRIAELSQAVGLITTLKPTMVMDANHPLDMVREVAEHVTARIAELEKDVEYWRNRHGKLLEFVAGKEG